MEDFDNPSYHMWSKLIPGYAGMDKNNKMKAKRAYVNYLGKQNVSEVHTREELNMSGFNAADCNQLAENYWRIKPLASATNYSLDCCDSSQKRAPSVPCMPQEVSCMKKNIKENNMYLNTNMTPTAVEVQQRQYLLEREEEVRHFKDQDLRTKFYLDEETPPKTPKELRERLAAGRFTIDGEDVNKFTCYQSAKDAIKWFNPATPADLAGYDAAEETLNTAATKVRDDIRIAPLADALASLRAFESTTVN